MFTLEIQENRQTPFTKIDLAKADKLKRKLWNKINDTELDIIRDGNLHEQLISVFEDDVLESSEGYREMLRDIALLLTDPEISSKLKSKRVGDRLGKLIDFMETVSICHREVQTYLDYCNLNHYAGSMSEETFQDIAGNHSFEEN